MTSQPAPPVSKPAFIESIVSDYVSSVAHTFVLHGGVFDYTDFPDRDLTVFDYLVETFARRFVVATYSPDRGIEFPNDAPDGPDAGQQRQAFDVACGLSTATLEQNSMAAMMRGGEPQQASDLPRVPSEALPLLIKFLGTRLSGDKRPCVIVDRLDLVAPPADKAMLSAGDRSVLSMLHRLGTDTTVFGSRGLCVMLTPTLEEIHPDLKSASAGLRAIEIAPPDFDQRLAYLRRKLERKNDGLDAPRVWLDGIKDVELAALAAGLYRRHLENIILRAVASGGALTRELALIVKREQIAVEYSGSIQVVEPEFGFEAVGGHQLVVDYLREWVIPTMVDPDLNEEAPTGILVMGPSGTGKTHLVSCFAKEAGLNFIIAKPEAFRDKYVGGSEAKTAKFFQGVSAMAPCAVFFDEADQKLRRGGGGDGSGGDQVENNIFASMLEFLSDPQRRGRVLAFAATNRPDNMDAALKRPGRFDTKIPLLPPQSNAERCAVLLALAKRYLPGEVAQLDLVPIAERTEDWTQAEIEVLVKKARTVARIKKLGLQEAFESVLSTMRSATQDIRTMTKYALAECDDASLVPERWRDLVGQTAKPVARRETVGIDRDSGRESRDLDI